MFAAVFGDAARRISVRTNRAEQRVPHFREHLEKSDAERRDAEKRESGRSVETASTSFSTPSVPTSPLGVLMAGGRSVRMEGILKVRVNRRKGRTPFGWAARFVVLEEGRIRISRSEDDDDDIYASAVASYRASSTSSGGTVQHSNNENRLNLSSFRDVRYNKRGAREFTIVLKSNQQVRFRAKNGEEAEIWLQHILQEMRNQAQLNLKCGELMMKQNMVSNVEPVLRQALFMMELSMGPKHKGVADVLDLLARFLAAQGDEQGASASQERAESIREASGPSRSAVQHFTGDNAGLREVRMWLELQNRADDGTEAMERAMEMQRREAELINIMSDQHASRIQELQNKAAAAERRARDAEKELALLRVAKRDRASLGRVQTGTIASLSGSSSSLTGKNMVAGSEDKTTLRRSVGRLIGRLSLSRKKSLPRNTPAAGLFDPVEEEPRASLSRASMAPRASENPASHSDFDESEFNEDRARPNEELDAIDELDVADMDYNNPRKSPTTEPKDDSNDHTAADDNMDDDEIFNMHRAEEEEFTPELARKVAESFQEQDLSTLDEMERELLELKKESEVARQESTDALRARMDFLKSKKKYRRNQGLSLQRSLDRRDTGACYLCHSETSQGTLYVRWSLDPVEDAIGRFFPGEGVKVPPFKYAHNQGRQELIRGLQGTGGNLRYFEGIIAFLKLAWEHRSVQVVITASFSPVRVYLWRDEFVFNVSPGAAFSLLGVEGITVVSVGSTLFSGIVKLPLEQFCVIGSQNGHSISLRRNKRDSFASSTRSSQYSTMSDDVAHDSDDEQ
eukprot:CAMPEP_0171568808 /NCGR_PEP_ID=MMETSP0961-20121227/1984_1 /TAXON_ID=87120 /ORGANISM="Aurantiochytrium limacinum, Strain ATCCMYA-1381" /LENGTH=798 /DNA_ID=CAMNT_0012123007 /DNA_START=117 /DNA_END=2513 /DNA_ORIENTATION=+